MFYKLYCSDTPCFTNESSPGFTSPVQSRFYNMPNLDLNLEPSHPIRCQSCLTFRSLRPITGENDLNSMIYLGISRALI